MTGQEVRRIVCVGLVLLIAVLMLTSLEHLMNCHGEEEHCPVCAALQTGRDIWLLCGLCFLFRPAGETKASLLFCHQTGVPAARGFAVLLTPVRLSVKMNN